MTAVVLPFQRPEDAPLVCETCEGKGETGHYHGATWDAPGYWCSDPDCHEEPVRCPEPDCDGGIVLCGILSCPSFAVRINPDTNEPECAVHRDYCFNCGHRLRDGYCDLCERLSLPALGSAS